MEKGVPDLGDEETAWETVSAFYDFWYKFKSWREFPHPDEEDPAQAEGRDHRRWIERQNQKLREKAKKDEGKRIREFIDSAFRLDPRVNLHREAEKQARQGSSLRHGDVCLCRLQKQLEKSKAREAAAAAEKEQAERAAALEREQEEAERLRLEQEKKEKENEKRALKEQRRRLRELCSGEAELIDGASLDYLCGKLDRAKIEKLCGFLETQSATHPDKCRTVLKVGTISV